MKVRVKSQFAISKYLIDKMKITMTYKSTCRIKRKYFIMLIGSNILHLHHVIAYNL